MANIVQLFSTLNAGIVSKHNDSDCLIYPKIDEVFRRGVRMSFNIPLDENVLIIRDTSFWGNYNQGTVVTDKGIYCIDDNEKPENGFSYNWVDIDQVGYQEQLLYFYNNGNILCSIPVYMFIKTNDVSEVARYGQILVNIFQQIANACEYQLTPADLAIQKIREYQTNDILQDEAKLNEACQLCYDYINEFSDYSGFFSQCLGKFYLLLSELDNDVERRHELLVESLKASRNAMSAFDPSHQLYIEANECNYVAAYKIGELEDARRGALEVALATDNNSEIAQSLSFNTVKIKEISTNDFWAINKEYHDTFLDKPYLDRKVIMVVNSFCDLSQQHFSLLDINSDFSKFSFPVGHPVANELYIAHPFICNKYIPFDRYQLEIVEDKVREFCTLVQALGATEISIECLNSNNTDQTNNGKRAISGNAQFMYDMNASVQQEYSQHLIEELSKSISLRQTYAPTNAPFMPEGLIWFDSEPSWQRLYNQRMTGGLLSHEERIESKKSQLLEGRELTDLKGEVESLFSKMNLEFNKTEELKYQIQENAVLAIHVNFAPLNQLITIDECIDVTDSLTELEEEYKKEYKEIFDDYGEIGPRERKTLEKIRMRLGIPEHRAKELENQAFSLTEEENEYLEEYNELLKDYGEIGPRERKRLEKCRTRLGISEKRCLELEDLKSSSQTNPIELEYLSELKECLEDYGEIGPRERKHLEKTRERLGLSEERAKELENSITD